MPFELRLRPLADRGALLFDLHKALLKVQSWCQEVALLQTGYFRGVFHVQSKEGNPSDLVTEVDFKSEQLILQHIAKEYPDHEILSEEAGAISGKDSDFLWIIDPLDGTSNFARGFGAFAISIALAYQGEVCLAVVLAPYLKETFHAIKSEGAFLNGKPIQAGRQKELLHAWASSSLLFEQSLSVDSLRTLHRLLGKLGGVRRLGAAAYELSAVGSGFFDLYFESGLKRWDVAAAALIAKEAGAIVKVQALGERYSVLAANPELFALIETDLWPFLSLS